MNESFSFLSLEFNINQAKELAQKYPTTEVTPLPQYNQGILINEEFAPKSDLTVPIIFATLVLGSEEIHILIDGHHRNHKAIGENKGSLPAVFLNVKDSISIISASLHMIKKLKKDAKNLGKL